MDANGLPIVGAAVDLTKVPSIHHKRTLAFLNHFIGHTVNFLNKFSSVCETKLEDINTRIQKIETSLSILETKLSSIPGLDDASVIIAVEASPPTQTPRTNIPMPEVKQNLPTPDTKGDESPIITPKLPVVNNSQAVEQSFIITVSKDPRYSKYFKLIQVGVPPLALRPKMLAEGLDPSLLDTPNAPAPPPGPKDNDSEFGTDTGSEDEFSD